MKKLIAIVFIITNCLLVNAQQDPAYSTTYPGGALLASGKGLPQFTKYDATLFDYSDKMFHITTGESATLNLRVILPKGTTNATYLQKLKTEKPQNLKYWTNDFYCYRIWCSHDNTGTNLVSEKNPWPSKLSDEPGWENPIIESKIDMDALTKTWSTCGLKWENIEYEIQSYLKTAKPGTKLYITYGVGYSYEVPGGQMESKWNDVLNIWEQVVSTGEIGFVYSTPIAVCTVDLNEDPAIANRFKNNGDGTITDNNSGLMWEKVPKPDFRTWQESMDYASNLTLASKTDWRLPTLTELKAMTDIVWENGQNYPTPYTWLNEHGFSGLSANSYWCSDSEDSYFAKSVDVGYGGNSNARKTFANCCAWVCRNK